ncbi:Radical SAM superfamily protein [uncultured archaeon]|nr:Radical SAM superfamily protein [uncultured archaeon]
MVKFVFFTFSHMQPLGLLLLQRRLRKNGVSCSIIDLNKIVGDGVEWRTVKGEHVKSFSSIHENEQKIRNELTRLGPRLRGAKYFGMTFFDSPSEMRTEVPLSRALRELYPQAKIIGGGPAFTGQSNNGAISFSKTIFSCAKLDYALRGEAENTLVELVKNLEGSKPVSRIKGIVYRDKGRIFVTKNPAMLSNEELQSESAVFAKHSKGNVLIYTERGCPFACIFCSVMRKGKPSGMNVEEIIQGLQKLAENKSVKQVQFMNEQLFFDRERATNLLGGMIKAGLNKRFRFVGVGTIDSFIKHGKVDTNLIRLIQNANFIGVHLGTEALNDNILSEIKGGRYKAADAIKVLDEFAARRVPTTSYLLAGGINTRAKDFLESYYNMLAKIVRGAKREPAPGFQNMAVINAHNGTPIHDEALKQGALFNRAGKMIMGDSPQRKISARYVVPKDPLLRKLFIEEIIRARGRNYAPNFGGTEDYKRILSLARELSQTDPSAAKLYRKLKKLVGQRFTQQRELGTIVDAITEKRLIEAMRRRKIKLTKRNIESFKSSHKRTLNQITNNATISADSHRYILSSMEDGTHRLASHPTLKSELPAARLFGIKHFRRRTGLSWMARTPVSRRR